MVFEMIYFEAFSNLPIYPKSDIIFLCQGTSTYVLHNLTKEGEGEEGSDDGNFWLHSVLKVQSNHKRGGSGSKNLQNMIT